MILITHHTQYPPRLRVQKGETVREEINLTPLLNERDDTISSVSWESDDGDISVSANSNDDYSATAEITANNESCANVTLTVTSANGQTIKQTIRVIGFDPEDCVDDYSYAW